MESAIRENIIEIRERIASAALRSGRKASEVRLMAVTKTVPDSSIKEAIEAGIKIIGENYVQEAKRKIEMMGQAAEWHLIGHLQTNKAKYAVKLFSMIHSVDRLEVAEELNRRCGALGRNMQVLIEVNVSGEATKRGMNIEQVIPLLEKIARMENLSVQGLMTMAPWFDDPENARPCFQALRELRDAIQKEGLPGIHMRELSMGMSDDYGIAIEEGATIVRIGRSIFGERSTR